MRWDDLQLLKVIDELEQSNQTGYLLNGYELLKQAAGGQTIEWGRDEAPFVHELLLAAEAGLVSWTDYTDRTVGSHDPFQNPSYWLQQIRDIRVTIAGRDRARGRVVMSPLPDPDEDDGRLVTAMTLEAIARAIGDMYGDTQLPRYLLDSGIPVEYLDAEMPAERWKYAFDVLMRLHDGSSAARRTLREFLGGWLDGHYHAPPLPEVRRKVVALLGQQGWHLSESRLVIGERTYDAAGVLTPLGRDVRIATLHPAVREASDRYIEAGSMEVAIFEAFKAVNNRVKAMSRLDEDGAPLMGRAFSEKNPLINLADMTSDTGRNIQIGFRFLFMGAIQGIRNPHAHEAFQPLTTDEGFEELGFASMLMRRLDEATIASS